MSSRVCDWVQSIVVGEKSLEVGILGILGSDDFHSRLSDSKYSHWLKAFGKRGSLDDDLFSILDFKNSQSSELLNRSIAIVSDFITHEAPLHRCGFSLFSNAKNRVLVLQAIYIPAGLPFVISDLNRVNVAPALFAATAEALLIVENITMGQRLSAFLLGLWSHLRSEIGQLNRELLRLLLPISNLPAVRKLMHSVNFSFDQYMGISQVPACRLLSNALVKSMEVISCDLELSSLTTLQVSNMTRLALKLPNACMWLLALEDKCANHDVTQCAFRFACLLDMFMGDTSDIVIEWLIKSKYFKEVLVFVSAQVKQNSKWQSGLVQSLKNATQTTLLTLVKRIYEECRESEMFILFNVCLTTPFIAISPKKTTQKRHTPEEPIVGNNLTELIKKLKRK